MVGEARTTHEVARYRHIGIGNGYTYLLLGSLARKAQSLGYGLAIIDQARRHTCNGLRNHRLDIYCTVLDNLSDGNDHLG